MRLDLFVSERQKCTRTRAANIIKMGGVSVNGKIALKAGAEVSSQDEVSIRDVVKFASLGGVKLENALAHFSLDLTGAQCLDLGAANGGFTHCMLSRGAASVDAVDLNLAFEAPLCDDPRITMHDGVNVKDVANVFPTKRFDFISADLSFISLRSLFPLFYDLLKEGGHLIVLFKPQYEVGKKYLPKSGVVHDKKAIAAVFSDLTKRAEDAGFVFIGACDVPDYFADKNKEKTVLFSKK